MHILCTSHHCILGSIVAFVTTCNAHLHSAKGSNKGSKNIFLVKIWFNSCIIINNSQMHPSEKITKQTVKYPFFLLTTSLSSQKRKISCNELHELGWVVWVTFICIDTEAVILPWSWTMVTQFLVWKIQCNKKCVNSTCNESHACMKGKKVFSVGPLYKNDTAEYMIL